MNLCKTLICIILSTMYICSTVKEMSIFEVWAIDKRETILVLYLDNLTLSAPRVPNGTYRFYSV